MIELLIIILILIGVFLPLFVGMIYVQSNGSPWTSDAGNISGMSWGILINANVTWWLVIVVVFLIISKKNKVV
jgi:large-conductance mechanosensitive channel